MDNTREDIDYMFNQLIKSSGIPKRFFHTYTEEELKKILMEDRKLKIQKIKCQIKG